MSEQQHREQAIKLFAIAHRKEYDYAEWLSRVDNEAIGIINNIAAVLQASEQRVWEQMINYAQSQMKDKP